MAAAAPAKGGDKNNQKQNDGAVDLINYKGIYFDDDSGEKYQCPETGAHFEYYDMYRRLNRVKRDRDRQDAADTQKPTKQSQGTKHEAKKSQTNLRKASDGTKKIVVAEAVADGSLERLPLRNADPNIDL